jgi:hypothetical protein
MVGSKETTSSAPSLMELTRKYRRCPAVTVMPLRPVIDFDAVSVMMSEKSSLSSS